MHFRVVENASLNVIGGVEIEGMKIVSVDRGIMGGLEKDSI